MNPGTKTHYCLFDTAIGACGVAWSRNGVTRLQLPEADASATEGVQLDVGTPLLPGIV
jgi:hypothetical protein